MKKLLKCAFNLDTACVELLFSDGTEIAFDTIAVENQVADTIYQQSELEWLIYNRPLEYAQLVLGGNLEEYVQGVPEHQLEYQSNNYGCTHRLLTIGGYTFLGL